MVHFVGNRVLFYYLTTGLVLDLDKFSNEYRPELCGGGIPPNPNEGGVMWGQSLTLLYIIAKIFTKKNSPAHKALLLGDYFCILLKIIATVREHFQFLYVNMFVYCTSSKYSLEDMRNDKYRDYPVLYTIRHSM